MYICDGLSYESMAAPGQAYPIEKQKCGRSGKPSTTGSLMRELAQVASWQRVLGIRFRSSADRHELRTAMPSCGSPSRPPATASSPAARSPT